MFSSQNSCVLWISESRINLIEQEGSLTWTNEGVQRRHEPHTITSEPPDLENDLQTPSWCLSLRLRASTILSPCPAFYIHHKSFFKKSQHDKIVYNDTLTFCIKKSILIEIKGFISVFLNFTNSLNCEEQLQGNNQDIKIKNLSAN